VSRLSTSPRQRKYPRLRESLLSRIIALLALRNTNSRVRILTLRTPIACASYYFGATVKSWGKILLHDDHVGSTWAVSTHAHYPVHSQAYGRNGSVSMHRELLQDLIYGTFGVLKRNTAKMFGCYGAQCGNIAYVCRGANNFCFAIVGSIEDLSTLVGWRRKKVFVRPSKKG
jgi:hypothetical protein